jgi:hypothetical protein
MISRHRVGYLIIVGLELFTIICAIPAAADFDKSLDENKSDTLQTSTIVSNVSDIIPVLETTSTMFPLTETDLPEIQRKTLNPSVQRKISTDLLYLIDSNVPENEVNRSALQKTMQNEGQLKPAIQSALEETKGLGSSVTTTQAGNFILVYIDIKPPAFTTTINSYVSSVTERNEEDHSVVAWVDVNNLDILASLDEVSNVRTAEPSVTKDTPVYHDTKFANKREGLPPLTVEDS